MHDKLDDMFIEQKSFQTFFYDPDNMSLDEKIDLSKEYILSAHRELGEVLNILPWKKHRKENKEINQDELKEEIIDCIKFIMNILIIWGVSADELKTIFDKKSQIVRERYHIEHVAHE